jgi:hypothetical protein
MEPLDLSVKTVNTFSLAAEARGSEAAPKKIWLPFVDDYRTRCIVPSLSFRLILESAT